MSTKALVEAVETMSPRELEILHAAVESRLWASADLRLSDSELDDAERTLAEADGDASATLSGDEAWAMLNAGRR